MYTKLQRKRDKTLKGVKSQRSRSIASLRLLYKFWILIGVLVLAGVSIILRVDTPIVWTFLYGIGGWAALTTNPGNNLR